MLEQMIKTEMAEQIMLTEMPELTNSVALNE